MRRTEGGRGLVTIYAKAIGELGMWPSFMTIGVVSRRVATKQPADDMSGPGSAMTVSTRGEARALSAEGNVTISMVGVATLGLPMTVLHAAGERPASTESIDPT
jgi:hypothetical protein